MRNKFATPLRAKCSPQNKLCCEEILRCKDFAYRVRLDFAKWPEEFSGYQVCGTFFKDDRLYITTRCQECPVAVFDRDGNFLNALGADLPIGRVHGIFKDSRGRILLADDGAHVIFSMDEDGRQLGLLGNYMQPSDTGFDSSIEGHLAYLTVKRRGLPFNKPTRLIQAPNGHYYASDGYGNAAVHHFDSSWDLIGSWGNPGTGKGDFSIVHSLIADSRNRIFVADRDNDRVQVFDETGSFLAELDSLLYPCDVAADSEYVYVAENDGRISIFNMDLQLEAQLGHSASEWRGHSITVDDRGNFYLGTLHGNYNLIQFERI